MDTPYFEGGPITEVNTSQLNSYLGGGQWEKLAQETVKFTGKMKLNDHNFVIEMPKLLNWLLLYYSLQKQEAANT